MYILKQKDRLLKELTHSFMTPFSFMLGIFQIFGPLITKKILLSSAKNDVKCPGYSSHSFEALSTRI